MKEMESFSKMALMAEPTMFHIGEAVGYRERVCLVKSTTATNHGFNTFELEDIDEDVVYVAYKHELVKAIDLPALSLGQEGEFAEILVRSMPEGAVPTAEAAVPDSAPLEHPISNAAATGGRFVRLTAAEVDSVASARTAKNTNEQTKWGTKNLQGYVVYMCFVYICGENVFGQATELAINFSDCFLKRSADRMFSLTTGISPESRSSQQKWERGSAKTLLAVMRISGKLSAILKCYLPTHICVYSRNVCSPYAT